MVRNAVVPSPCLRSAFASGSLPSMEHQRTYNFTTDLQRTCIGGSWKFSQNLIEACINSGDGFGMFFLFFLKDNVYIVIAIENNGIIVTWAFSRLYIIFQAYRIRWSSQKLMIIVLLLRLSAAYIPPPIFYNNSLIIFILDNHNPNHGLAQRASRITISNK